MLALAPGCANVRTSRGRGRRASPITAYGTGLEQRTKADPFEHVGDPEETPGPFPPSSETGLERSPMPSPQRGRVGRLDITRAFGSAIGTAWRGVRRTASSPQRLGRGPVNPGSPGRRVCAVYVVAAIGRAAYSLYSSGSPRTENYLRGRGRRRTRRAVRDLFDTILPGGGCFTHFTRTLPHIHVEGGRPKRRTTPTGGGHHDRDVPQVATPRPRRWTSGVRDSPLTSGEREHFHKSPRSDLGHGRRDEWRVHELATVTEMAPRGLRGRADRPGASLSPTMPDDHERPGGTVGRGTSPVVLTGMQALTIRGERDK